jgi:hypothetical protein
VHGSHPPNCVMRCSSHVIPGCPFSCRTLGEPGSKLPPPFESLVVQNYFSCRFFLVDHLHEQEFVFLLIDVPLDIAWACLCSCVGLGVGA